jgi:TatD DNase family protein
MSASTYRLVDSHAHLDEIGDVESAVREAQDAGVVALVAVGQDYESNLKVLDLAERYNGLVFAALGLHPWNLGAMTARDVDAVLRQVEAHIRGIVAIGEIGLDYHKRVRAAADKDRQQAAFTEMLNLARRHRKPVSVHSRYSWKDSFDLVVESGVAKAVFHWYTGFTGVLREIVSAGCLISATPAAEYHDEHRRAIKETPLESLLLETDCPVWYGRETKYESRPADIVRSLHAVAGIKGLDASTIAERTTRNAIELFSLPLGERG